MGHGGIGRLTLWTLMWRKHFNYGVSQCLQAQVQVGIVRDCSTGPSPLVLACGQQSGQCPETTWPRRRRRSAHLQGVGGVAGGLAALAVALAVSGQQSACQVHRCPPVLGALVGAWDKVREKWTHYANSCSHRRRGCMHVCECVCECSAEHLIRNDDKVTVDILFKPECYSLWLDLYLRVWGVIALE